MTKTNNYNLKKPEPNDPLRVADFNENADILDAALNSLNTVVGNVGNCIIATGSYVGDGTFDSRYPNHLDFEFKPLLVVLIKGAITPSGGAESMDPSILMRPASGGTSVTGKALAVTWGDRSVEWYCNSSQSAGAQGNEEGRTYYWTAVGVTE